MIPQASPNTIYVDEYNSSNLPDDSSHESENPKFYNLEKDDEEDFWS